MNKLFCVTLVLLALLGCLTACNFSQNLSGALAGKAESTAKVEEMMTALAEHRMSDAKALIHPQAAEKFDTAITQISTYLSGRKIRSMELTNINVNTSTGTSGKTRQEQVVYQITLNDGEVIYLNVVYLSNSVGSGFASFQLVLGMV